MANETDRNIARNQRPPKSKNGGRRPGAGRPRGSRNRRTIALSQAPANAQQSARTGETPLDFLLRVMRNTKNVLQVRIDAAKAAAPYVHARLGAVELNQNQRSESHEERLERLAKKYGYDSQGRAQPLTSPATEHPQ